MEHIEQSLSDVLQSQALSPEEGREVAEALVGALTAIHQSGMSHGHVEAASVLATEETVKLRSDCLHISTAGQAEDVAGIGTTLFHAFTQRKALTATDAQINRIPAPFAEIIRNSFARRWTLGANQQCVEAGSAGGYRDAAACGSCTKSYPSSCSAPAPVPLQLQLLLPLPLVLPRLYLLLLRLRLRPVLRPSRLRERFPRRHCRRHTGLPRRLFRWRKRW